MIYKRTIFVNDRETEHIRSVLSGKETVGGDGVITHAALFPEGMRLEVNVVDCRQEPADGVERPLNGRTAWTEAVLFDRDGHEAGHTGKGEEYFGWTGIAIGFDIYVVNIVPETPPITKERIVEGIEKGLVRFAPEPGAVHGTACHIGGNWFWFGGSMAEEEDPEQYLADVPMEDVVDKVHEALSSLRLWMETAGTYARCDAFLRENGA